MFKCIENTLLEILIIEEQGEELVIAHQAFKQCFICIVIEAKCKVIFVIIFRADFNILVFEKQVFNLKHGFGCNIRIKRLTGSGVNIIDDSRK